MKITATFAIFAIFGTVQSGYISEGHGGSFGGLRRIAQGSANEAHTAVSNQHEAARQASYIAKNTLAQQALQAAATAQAALAGKHVLLQALERQRDEVHRDLEGELSQLQSAKDAAAVSAGTAEQAVKHIKILQQAVNNAQELSIQAEGSAAHAAQEVESQMAMVRQAKAKLEEIDRKLEATQSDFAATMEAAEKAARFAQKAKSNAAEVGAHSGGDSSGHGGSFGGNEEDGHEYFR